MEEVPPQEDEVHALLPSNGEDLLEGVDGVQSPQRVLFAKANVVVRCHQDLQPLLSLPVVSLLGLTIFSIDVGRGTERRPRVCLLIYKRQRPKIGAPNMLVTIPIMN